MTIYFDENKKAHSYEIKNAITSIDDKTWEEYCNKPTSWDIINGKFVDKKDSQAHLEYLNEIHNKEIEDKIFELDKKRIRAIAEPCLRNQETGETWLEYYTLKIQELRTQIKY